MLTHAGLDYVSARMVATGQRPARKLSANTQAQALELLQQLGYTYLPAEALKPDRESERQPLVTGRLQRALLRLNPWLTESQLTQVMAQVAALTLLQGGTLAAASHALHRLLTCGLAIAIDPARPVYARTSHLPTSVLAAADGAFERPSRQQQPWPLTTAPNPSIEASPQSRTVAFFDFAQPLRNDWVVTQHYPVQGQQQRACPDLVLLVNGVPLAVLQCLPQAEEPGWQTPALVQLRSYQELEPAAVGSGIPCLFTTVQVLLVLGQTAAVCGTVTSPDTDYSSWSSAWPLAADALPALLQRPALAQDVTIAGVCVPQNLLDLLRNFVAFSPLAQPATDPLRRRLAWCGQFALVNRALQRCRLASGPEMWATASWDASVFGGVLCVPPGGGPSLIISWLALKLRRDRQADHPTLLLLTNRPSLSAQLRQLFADSALPHPVSADDSQQLLQLLVGPGGQTLVATVQQLRALQQGPPPGRKSPASALVSPRLREELALESLEDGHLAGLVSQSLRDDLAAARPPDWRAQARGPALSTARNLFVLIDNVQQPQSLGLLMELRRALPNAIMFGISEELDAATCGKDAALAVLGRAIEATDCVTATSAVASRQRG